LRFMVPPPQVVVHEPQSFQEETTQSIGQEWVLQVVAADKVGHTIPPWRGLTRI
jgi:hypothetical protein